MKTFLIEPADVLFFRDGIPMSAGQGKGAGCRLPFPSTVHEAIRSTLLLATGEDPVGKRQKGRPPTAPRKGNWHDRHDGKTFIASRSFRSLRTIGPLPFLERDRMNNPPTWRERRDDEETGVRVSYEGLLLPVPLDATFEIVERRGTRKRVALKRLRLWRNPEVEISQNARRPEDWRPPCLPAAVSAPDKHGRLHGWWTVAQMQSYLETSAARLAREDNAREYFRPLPANQLWQGEHRIGVRIDPASFACCRGQLYAGSYLRAHATTRLAVQLEIGDPRARSSGEAAAIERLEWLLLGGEHRLARLWDTRRNHQPFSQDPFDSLKEPPQPPAMDGPCLLKWILATPALFAHGHLPGWCWNETDNRPPGEVRLGPSRRKAGTAALPDRARLISWCLGPPQTVSGWDVADGCAKPTQLAVPPGSVYYFLCENQAAASALARKLQWQPRSDRYGEKGCGYGLCSYDVHLHRTSPDVSALARECFNLQS